MGKYNFEPLTEYFLSRIRRLIFTEKLCNSKKEFKETETFEIKKEIRIEVVRSISEMSEESISEDRISEKI